MEFTGERPFDQSELTSSRMRYKTILPFCAGKNVLDFGCGIGYGSYLLSKFAKNVVGFDIDKEAVEIATKKFAGKGNPVFRNTLHQSEMEPHRQDRRDIVAAVESIEHLEKEDLVQQLKVFKNFAPELVATTPNGDLFPYHPGTKADRIGFHTWHYTYDELVLLFLDFYAFVEVMPSIYDPYMNEFTGYLIYASNLAWDNSWYFKEKGPEG